MKKLLFGNSYDEIEELDDNDDFTESFIDTYVKKTCKKVYLIINTF